MGISGERFLKLSGAQGLRITLHALERIGQRAGGGLSEEEALHLFHHARQVSAKEAIYLGYRPTYGRRCNEGQKSWYFLMALHGQELLAVIGQDTTTGELYWATTYALNRQNEQYRLATPAMLGLAA